MTRSEADGKKKRIVARTEPEGSFSFWQRVQLLLISTMGWALIRLLGSTLRFTIEGEEPWSDLRGRGRSAVMTFWHNQILMAAYYFRSRGIVVITSEHFDGEYIARIIRWLGYGTARGSSTRGGVKALLQLRKHLDQGVDVAFTIDGPRGPRYVAKPGPVLLGRRSGAPIIAFHVEPRRYWELRSWDGFRIPKPFSEVHIRFAAPLFLTPESDVDDGHTQLQATLDHLRSDLERYWDHPRG